MPHPDIDPEEGALFIQFGLERLGLPSGDFEKGRFSADEAIAFFDEGDHLRRGGALFHDVAKKRFHIVEGVGPAVGHQENGDFFFWGSVHLTRAFFVNHFHDRRDMLDRRLGEDAVAEIEDMPGRLPARFKISSTRFSISERGAKRTTGSRFPWTATAFPNRAQASSKLTRQSNPMTSP